MVRKSLIFFLVLATFFVQGQEDKLEKEKDTKENREDRKEKRVRKRKKDTSEVIFQPQRLEIPVKDMRDDFEVIDGYEGGVLIVQNTNEDVENGEIWQFYLVNRELEIEWKITRVIDHGVDLIGFDYSLGYFFLLFDEPRRYREYKVMVIDTEGEKAVISDIELPFVMELQYFEALDNGILLVGQYNYRPVALVHDILGDKPKVLPGFYNYNERIFDLVLDEDNKTFSIALAERMRNGKYTNRIKSFTYDGLLIEENLINPGEELNLVDGTSTNFGGGVQYMAGTYSRKASVYSRGIYISKFTNGQQRFLKSHNYGDLSNFFAYKGERGAKRIARKVQRKKARGKEPKFSFRLYIHDIFPRGDLNILIAEAYYARYSSSAPTSSYGLNPYATGISSQSGQPRYSNFLGYKFTHAIVLAFDSNGDIVWDNSFKTNDITSYNLEESVAVNIQGDKAVIMYLDDDEIRSKAVEGNQVIEGKTYNQIRLNLEGDKVKGRSSEVRGIKNWYSNYLYSYGIQRIKNKNQPKPKTRKVFYINKIQFDQEVDAEDSEFRVSSVK